MQVQLRSTGCSNRLTSKRSRQFLQVRASIHARWCLDVRYGCKTEATALLQEWVQTVGSKAGLNGQNTRLSSGCLGVPESRLEMEVTFDSLADWEAFLAVLPFQEHKAWTQRIQSMVVDGSPVWQVHRSVPVLAAGATATSAAAGLSSSPRKQAAVPDKQQLVITDQISTEDMLAWQQLTNNGSGQQRHQQQQQQQPAEAPAEAPAVDVPLDWKGEPMKLNPGDKLPFKFL